MLPQGKITFWSALTKCSFLGQYNLIFFWIYKGTKRFCLEKVVFTVGVSGVLLVTHHHPIPCVMCRTRRFIFDLKS